MVIPLPLCPQQVPAVLRGMWVAACRRLQAGAQQGQRSRPPERAAASSRNSGAAGVPTATPRPPDPASCCPSRCCSCSALALVGLTWKDWEAWRQNNVEPEGLWVVKEDATKRCCVTSHRNRANGVEGSKKRSASQRSPIVNRAGSAPPNLLDHVLPKV